MVTKAELERQVADLKRQLEDKTDSRDSDAPEPPQKGAENLAGRMSAELEDWSSEIESALSELDDLPHKKAILFALGVFALGYVIGRSR